MVSQAERAMLVEHLIFAAFVEYGYSRMKIIGMSTEFAISLGHREKNLTLSIDLLRLNISSYEDGNVKSVTPDLRALQ